MGSLVSSVFIGVGSGGIHLLGEVLEGLERKSSMWAGGLSWSLDSPADLLHVSSRLLKLLFLPFFSLNPLVKIIERLKFGETIPKRLGGFWSVFDAGKSLIRTIFWFISLLTFLRAYGTESVESFLTSKCVICNHSLFSDDLDSKTWTAFSCLHFRDRSVHVPLFLEIHRTYKLNKLLQKVF